MKPNAVHAQVQPTVHTTGLNRFGSSKPPEVTRIETPEQRRRRELQARTMEVQKNNLKNLLARRLHKAEQNNDIRLIHQLRQEWCELFPEEAYE